MSEFGKWDDGTPIPPCFTCEPEDSKHGVHLPADVIAMVPSSKGGIAFAAPLCRSHAQVGLVAGWHPQLDIKSPEGRKAWDEHGWLNPKRAPQQSGDGK